MTEGREDRPATMRAAAVRHVLLGYQYLDEGDLDAYGSLLDDDVRIDRPDVPAACGRDEVLRVLRTTGGWHELRWVRAHGDRVVAEGLYHSTEINHEEREENTTFTDFFHMSADALMVTCQRFYCTRPISS